MHLVHVLLRVRRVGAALRLHWRGALLACPKCVNVQPASSTLATAGTGADGGEPGDTAAALAAYEQSDALVLHGTNMPTDPVRAAMRACAMACAERGFRGG